MTRGRHGGKRYWGILYRTGRNPRNLPYDIQTLAFRIGGTGAYLAALAGIVLMVSNPEGRASSLAYNALPVATALIVAGLVVGRYRKSAFRYSRIQEADRWIQAVYMHRVVWLMRREKAILCGIEGLQDRFEAEKAALQEVREERMAQERMVGFIKGLQESPAMMAYLDNPRNRLRVVRDPGEQSA